MSARTFSVLWSDMYGGSLAGRGLAAVVFPALIALKDADNVVPYSPRALAHLWGLPEADVVAALDDLSSPDPHSRNPAEGGRRIVLVPGEGYRIVSGYRDQERFRARAKRAAALKEGGAK